MLLQPRTGDGGSRNRKKLLQNTATHVTLVRKKKKDRTRKSSCGCFVRTNGGGSDSVRLLHAVAFDSPSQAGNESGSEREPHVSKYCLFSNIPSHTEVRFVTDAIQRASTISKFTRSELM